ncbi:uncharacterized [Tachysurus ichikawai]
MACGRIGLFLLLDCSKISLQRTRLNKRHIVTEKLKEPQPKAMDTPVFLQSAFEELARRPPSPYKHPKLSISHHSLLKPAVVLGRRGRET